MYLLCVSLIVIVSVLMCLIVLIQNSKGGGLASGFASSNQIMGVRKTTDFLEKATWTLAGLMVVISILAAYSLPSREVVDSFDSQAVESYETAAETAELPVEE
ncbi:MAG: preprotein translocase subunit SecG [Bacteroidaceae bacterium]|nr:preprotein translocase subunit SecG [Bacteroidaceae bacterium]